MSNLLVHLKFGLMGVCMGLILSAIGFTDYDEMFKMFTFSEYRMLMAFAFAVGVAAIIFGSLHISKIMRFQHKIYHPGVIPGSILFGYGWAMCGACPGIVFIQLGQGKLPALVTMLGILIGVRMYRYVHARYFQWDSGICGV